MIRILIFLLTIVLIAGTVTYFASLEGRIQAEAFGLKFDGSSGLVAGGFAALIIAVIYVTSVVKNLLRLPAAIKARDAETRRARGVAALTRGLEAVAAGDASDATHHARIARRHLDEASLTRLLTAQAAHMSGDDASAKENYSAMLEAPETEFLGLRGLYLQAMARDDTGAAGQYAQRAFALRANARWAFDSVFDLCLARGAWGEARAALAKARRNNLLTPEKINRAEVVLLAADASAALLAGDGKTALSETEAALKLAPGFTPAAVAAARLYSDKGRKGKAAKVIENAFVHTPHPALGVVFDALYNDESPADRADHFNRLASKAPSSREAQLLRARGDILLEQWPAAIAKVEPLLADAPTAEVFSLMAAAMAGEYSGEAGRGWLERAAAAPLDPRPGADGEFHFTRQGWAQLVREYMDHERLAPPPLEAAPVNLSSEEIRLLTAPPTLEKSDDETIETENAAAPEEGVLTPEYAADEDRFSENGVSNEQDAKRAANAAREVS